MAALYVVCCNESQELVSPATTWVCFIWSWCPSVCLSVCSCVCCQHILIGHSAAVPVWPVVVGTYRTYQPFSDWFVWMFSVVDRRVSHSEQQCWPVCDVTAVQRLWHCSAVVVWGLHNSQHWANRLLRSACRQSYWSVYRCCMLSLCRNYLM